MEQVGPAESAGRSESDDEVRGAIDGIQDGVLYGWATWDNGPLRLSVLVDGVELAASDADLARPDLAEAGIGDCGYRIPLPRNVLDGQLHQFELRIAGTSDSILGGAFHMTTPKADRSTSNGGDVDLGAGADDVLRDPASSAKLRAVFDADFYLQENPDVAQSGLDPFGHFVTQGWREERRPSPDYDESLYLRNFPEARGASLPASFHWALNGAPKEYRPERAKTTRRRATEDGEHVVLDTVRLDLDPPPIRLKPSDFDEVFDEEAYRALYEDAESHPEGALAHYLTVGIYQGYLPTPDDLPPGAQDRDEEANLRAAVVEFLDADFYIGEYADVRKSGVDPLEHFLRSGYLEKRYVNALAKAYDTGVGLDQVRGLWARGAKVRLFDEEYYLRTYPDVRKSGVDALEHFLGHGAGEGRAPNAWFDPDWYAAANSLAPGATDLFGHYLSFGLMYDSVPMSEYSLLAGRNGDLKFSEAQYALLLEATKQLDAHFQFRLADTQLFCQVFDPTYYRFVNGLPGSTSAAEAIYHYLTVGVHEGQPLSQAFDHKNYFARAGLQIPSNPVRQVFGALRHWYETGRREGVSPASVLDQTFYAQENSDLDPDSVNLAEHFVLHGNFEGRRVSTYPPVAVSVWREASRTFDGLNLLPRPFRHAEDGMQGELARVSSILFSRELEDSISAAQKIEPAIQSLAETERVLTAPRHASYSVVLREVLSELKRDSYDYVVCVPWIRMGGADYIASILAGSLKRLSEDGSVLVIQTDATQAERKGWYDRDIEILDISKYMSSNLGPDAAQHFLFSLLRRICRTAVFNANSKALFEVYARYGRRLTAACETYSYYFCWDQTDEGRRVGYPSDYFPVVASRTTGTITDSGYLRDELIRLYRIPESQQSKIQVLRTPHVPEGEDGAVTKKARRANRALGPGARPLFLWAGRFDRQKRFDLLVEVARAMPDVDFWVWGQFLLDEGRKLPDLPINMVVRKPYTSFDELPLNEATGWLYTSGWDGIPTILIELAARSVPIVASRVGGVGELIDKTTGWPIDPDADVADYVAAITELASSPELALKKAKALQRRASKLHSTQEYESALRSFLNNG